MYADTNLEYKQADGGHADPLSTIPYIMLNAGAAYGGRLDYWDLNGDGAEEHINETINKIVELMDLSLDLNVDLKL